MHFCKIDNIQTKIKPSKLRLLHKSRPCLNVYLTNFVPTGEVLHLSRNPDQCVLQVNGATLNHVETFKYLGVAFASDERQDEELDTRIGKASAVMRA